MALATTTLKTVTEWETREQTANAIPAMHRLLVTVLGRAIFGLMNVAERRDLWLVVVLVLLQFLIEVVVAWHYTLGRPFITPTALTISARAARTCRWPWAPAVNGHAACGCHGHGTSLDQRVG